MESERTGFVQEFIGIITKDHRNVGKVMKAQMTGIFPVQLVGPLPPDWHLKSPMCSICTHMHCCIIVQKERSQCSSPFQSQIVSQVPTLDSDLSQTHMWSHDSSPKKTLYSSPTLSDWISDVIEQLASVPTPELLCAMPLTSNYSEPVLCLSPAMCFLSSHVLFRVSNVFFRELPLNILIWQIFYSIKVYLHHHLCTLCCQSKTPQV
jgi:hypothetical protein